MRQFLFVVAMIGAAFLGGVVVNGPGLRWVQARLLDYMGLQDGGEIASIDLPPANADPADPRLRQPRRQPARQAHQPSLHVTNRRQSSRLPEVFPQLNHPGRNPASRRPRQFLRPYRCRRRFPSRRLPGRLLLRTRSSPGRPGWTRLWNRLKLDQRSGPQLQVQALSQVRRPLILAWAKLCWPLARPPQFNPLSRNSPNRCRSPWSLLQAVPLLPHLCRPFSPRLPRLPGAAGWVLQVRPRTGWP